MGRPACVAVRRPRPLARPCPPPAPTRPVPPSPCPTTPTARPANPKPPTARPPAPARPPRSPTTPAPHPPTRERQPPTRRRPQPQPATPSSANRPPAGALPTCAGGPPTTPTAPTRQPKTGKRPPAVAHPAFRGGQRRRLLHPPPQFRHPPSRRRPPRLPRFPTTPQPRPGQPKTANRPLAGAAPACPRCPTSPTVPDPPTRNRQSPARPRPPRLRRSPTTPTAQTANSKPGRAGTGPAKEQGTAGSVGDGLTVTPAERGVDTRSTATKFPPPRCLSRRRIPTMTEPFGPRPTCGPSRSMMAGRGPGTRGTGRGCPRAQPPGIRPRPAYSGLQPSEFLHSPPHVRPGSTCSCDGPGPDHSEPAVPRSGEPSSARRAGCGGEGGLEPPHPFGHRNLNPAASANSATRPSREDQVSRSEDPGQPGWRHGTVTSHG